MADVVTRLRVNSSEYENKIKRAQDGLLKLEQTCRQYGGTLAILDKDEKNFVASLGTMETVAKSSKGKLNELTQAYTELSLQYRRLTDEEKRGDYGKALASSLDQLKTRINETKGELGDVNRELNGSKGFFDGLSDRITVNVDALTLFNAGLSVSKVALGVAKDAFISSESNIDEWGRTVEGAKGAYNVFLDTLNGGNWSSFFDNLDDAVRGARDLYDAFDRLGSVKANNQVAISLVQAEIRRLNLLKQQGKEVDEQLKKQTQLLAELQKQGTDAGITAGKESVKQTLRTAINSYGGRDVWGNFSLDAVVSQLGRGGQDIFDQAKKNYERLLKKQEYTKLTSYSPDPTIAFAQVTETKDYNINRLSEEEKRQFYLTKAITEKETEIQKGLSVWAQAVNERTGNLREEFKNNRYAISGSGSGKKESAEKTEIQSNQSEIEKLIAEYTQLADAAKQTSGAEALGTYDRMDAIKEEIGVLQRRNEELKRYSEEARGNVARPDFRAGAPTGIQAIPMYSPDDDRAGGVTQAAVAKLTADFQAALQTTDLADPIIGNLQRGLVDSNTLGTLLKIAVESGLDTANIDFAGLKEQIGHGIDVPDGVWEELQAKINEQLAELQIDPIKIDLKTGNVEGVKQMNKDADNMAHNWSAAASAIQSAGSALGNIEDPAAKVAGTIALAIANIAATFAASLKGTFTPWDWIAAAAAGTATMVSTIATIRSVTKGGFAEGGIVPGNSMSGDRLLASDYGINSGELILNKAQQGNLASQLEGGGSPMGGSSVQISSENIRIILHNAARRRGMSVGEYLNL